jgi:hypothetical protein
MEIHNIPSQHISENIGVGDDAKGRCLGRQMGESVCSFLL